MDFIMDTLMPIASHKNAAVIAISTLNKDVTISDFNFMIEARDAETQELIFEKFHYSLSCKECAEANIHEGCKHVISSANWLSKRKKRAMEALYKGREASNAVENYGILQSNNKFAFDRKSINFLFDRPRVEITERPQLLYLAIDPNGGGSSDVSITLATIERGVYTVSFGPLHATLHSASHTDTNVCA